MPHVGPLTQMGIMGSEAGVAGLGDEDHPGLTLDPLTYPQFWSASVSCQTQDQTAVRLALEQIDLIRRMCASYSELELVTSAEGGPADERIVRMSLWRFCSWDLST